MPRDRLRIDHQRSDYYCFACDRQFDTAQGALSHCRTAQAHVGQWCERCQWLFESRTDRSLHCMNSPHHHICQDCDDDFESAAELNDHIAELHRPIVRHRDRSRASTAIQRIPTGRPPPPPPVRQVQQVRRNYQSQSIDCFGCDEQFNTRSAMLMHLESGACVSRINLEDIDRWAFRERRSAGWESREDSRGRVYDINHNTRSSAWTRPSEQNDYTNEWRDYYRYRCPTCNTNFRVVSALLQHIEEQNCGQRIGGAVARMVNYIEFRLLQ